MDLSTNKNFLEEVGRAHTNIKLRVPHHMVSASIETIPSFYRARTIKLDAGFG